MRVSGVLFDFDGVLVDSLPAHLSAWVEATRNVLGATLTNPERLTGRATVAIARLICEECGGRGRDTDLIKEKSRLLLDKIADVKPFSGVAETLERLRAATVPFAVASNAPRAFVLRVLTEHRLEVPLVLGREDAARPKPAPDLFLAAAVRLGLSIDAQRTTLVFEDSAHGLRAATDARLIPAGITSQHSASELFAAGARFVATSIAEAFDGGVQAADGNVHALTFNERA